MLSHSWTYQALIHDILEMKLNRIVVEVKKLYQPVKGWNDYQTDLPSPH
jgi:hypothetical protein